MVLDDGLQKLADELKNEGFVIKINHLLCFSVMIPKNRENNFEKIMENSLFCYEQKKADWLISDIVYSVYDEYLY